MKQLYKEQDIANKIKRDKKMGIKTIRIVLVMLLMGTFYMIFDFSSQDGQESGGLSRKVTTIIVKKILFISDDRQKESIEQIEPIIRKLAHFSIYTVTGILLMSLASTYQIETMKKIYISMLIGMAYAISDEIHQVFVPGRAAKLTDVMIDTIGVGIGIAMVWIIVKNIKQRMKKK